jgi:hypothetical protein
VGLVSMTARSPYPRGEGRTRGWEDDFSNFQLLQVTSALHSQQKMQFEQPNV